MSKFLPKQWQGDPRKQKVRFLHQPIFNLQPKQPLDDFDKEYDDNNTDHLMLPVLLQEERNKIRTNTMVDSGATLDFIDRNFCLRYQIKVWKKE
jgi:hypothetical protein